MESPTANEHVVANVVENERRISTGATESLPTIQQQPNTKRDNEKFPWGKVPMENLPRLVPPWMDHDPKIRGPPYYCDPPLLPLLLRHLHPRSNGERRALPPWRCF